MAVEQHEVRTDFTARNEMSPELDDLARKFEQLGDRARGAEQEANKLADSLGDTARQGSALSSILGKVGIAAGITAIELAALGAAAIAGIGIAVKAAAEQEVSILRLKSAVEATGESWERAGSILESWVRRMGLVGLTDEQVRDALGTLTLQTGSYEKALSLLGITINLARGRQMSLASAALLVGRVAEGNVGILGRYGIQVGENATAVEALTLLQERYAGQAEAYGESYAGAMDRVSAALNTLKDTIGAKVLPSLTYLVDAFATTIEKGGVLYGVVEWLAEKIGSALPQSAEEAQLAIENAFQSALLFVENAMNIMGGAIATFLERLSGLIKWWANIVETGQEMLERLGVSVSEMDKKTLVWLQSEADALSNSAQNWVNWGTTAISSIAAVAQAQYNASTATGPINTQAPGTAPGQAGWSGWDVGREWQPTFPAFNPDLFTTPIEDVAGAIEKAARTTRVATQKAMVDMVKEMAEAIAAGKQAIIDLLGLELPEGWLIGLDRFETFAVTVGRRFHAIFVALGEDVVAAATAAAEPIEKIGQAISSMSGAIIDLIDALDYLRGADLLGRMETFFATLGLVFHRTERFVRGWQGLMGAELMEETAGAAEHMANIMRIIGVDLSSIAPLRGDIRQLMAQYFTTLEIGFQEAVKFINSAAARFTNYQMQQLAEQSEKLRTIFDVITVDLTNLMPIREDAADWLFRYFDILRLVFHKAVSFIQEAQTLFDPWQMTQLQDYASQVRTVFDAVTLDFSQMVMPPNVTERMNQYFTGLQGALTATTAWMPTIGEAYSALTQAAVSAGVGATAPIVFTYNNYGSGGGRLEAERMAGDLQFRYSMGAY